MSDYRTVGDCLAAGVTWAPVYDPWHGQLPIADDYPTEQTVEWDEEYPR